MKTILSIILGALTSNMVLADDYAAKHSDQAEAEAKLRGGKIATELKTMPNHAWAGSYYAGDGLGVNTLLSIAPQNGFVFEWHGCLGLYDRNYGTTTWTNNLLRLAFTFENKQEGFQGLASELIVIPWGKRQYLIPANEIVEFCNHINQGAEPRQGVHGFFLLRIGDETNHVAGLPKVPKEFESYLLAKPIEAKIISVGTPTIRPSTGKWNYRDTPVVLDVGTKGGLLVGMELLITKPTRLVETVEITKVEENHAEAIMTQYGEAEPAPQIGWQACTKAPWHKAKTK